MEVGVVLFVLVMGANCGRVGGAGCGSWRWLRVWVVVGSVGSGELDGVMGAEPGIKNEKERCFRIYIY